MPIAVSGQESMTRTLAAKGAGHVGKGQACRTDRPEIHAPDNHIPAQGSLEVPREDRDGKGPCRDETVQRDNLVEVIPDVTRPATLIMSVSARSDDGMLNAVVRGWLRCTHKVNVAMCR